jgi:hypothetical protein
MTVHRVFYGSAPLPHGSHTSVVHSASWDACLRLSMKFRIACCSQAAKTLSRERACTLKPTFPQSKIRRTSRSYLGRGVPREDNRGEENGTDAIEVKFGCGPMSPGEEEIERERAEEMVRDIRVLEESSRFSLIIVRWALSGIPIMRLARPLICLVAESPPTLVVPRLRLYIFAAVRRCV